MNVLLMQLESQLPALKVYSVAVPRGGTGIEITLRSCKDKSIRFTTDDFEIGHRGVKTAALAKFAACSGFGEVEAIYRYLVGLPQDMTGVLFSAAGSAEECVGPGSLNWPSELAA
jgi:hypothetical protein